MYPSLENSTTGNAIPSTVHVRFLSEMLPCFLLSSAPFLRGCFVWSRVRSLGYPNALTESNSWHSDHVETEESFYPHPSPISVSALPAARVVRGRAKLRAHLMQHSQLLSHKVGYICSIACHQLQKSLN